MNKEQAISVIEQALNLASNKGVFNLKDASIIFSAFTIVKEYLEFPINKEYHDLVGSEVITEEKENK